MLLMQILNFSHPAWGGVDIECFQCKFSIVVTPPEEGWIYISFITDF